MQMTEVQSLVLKHWKSMARKHRGLPAREDFRLQDLGRHVTDIVVMDVERNPTDFTYRLIGSSVAENLADNYTGKSLSELPGKGPDSCIWSNMKTARDTKEPIVLEVPYVGPNTQQSTLNSLYLPLATNHTEIDKIMVVPNFPPKRKVGLFSPQSEEEIEQQAAEG